MLVGFYFCPPDQEKDIRYIMYGAIREATKPNKTVIIDHFNDPHKLSKSHRTKSMENPVLNTLNGCFLGLLFLEDTRGEAVLGCTLNLTQERFQEVAIVDPVSNSDYSTIQFSSLGGGIVSKTSIMTPDFGKQDLKRGRSKMSSIKIKNLILSLEDTYAHRLTDGMDSPKTKKEKRRTQK